MFSSTKQQTTVGPRAGVCEARAWTELDATISLFASFVGHSSETRVDALMRRRP